MRRATVHPRAFLCLTFRIQSHSLDAESTRPGRLASSRGSAQGCAKKCRLDLIVLLPSRRPARCVSKHIRENGWCPRFGRQRKRAVAARPATRITPTSFSAIVLTIDVRAGRQPGGHSSSLTLQYGQGIPAPPHWQAYSPSQGLLR
jgi:hypothetical protein